MTLRGKGQYIWQVPEAERGNPQAIAQAAQEARLSHVLIKVAEGVWRYNVTQQGIDLVQPVIEALHAVGIEVWGWQYVYGNNPNGEAAVAIRRCRELDLDGYVINAEAEYKQPGKAPAAELYTRQVREGIPSHIPLALSSYRWPYFHLELPWREFLARCDLNMPQVYWIHGTNPPGQLQRTLVEFERLSRERGVRHAPIFPTGAAFREHGWQPTPAEVLAFMQAAEEFGLEGFNFWRWGHARHYGYWEMIAAYHWPGSEPEPAPLPEPGALRFRVLTNNLRVRSQPNGTEIGRLSAGQIVTAYDVAGPNAWILHESGYSAVEYEGQGRHMEVAVE